MKTNLWPVAITAFCMAFAGAMAGFVIFAVRQPNDLVAPDYYARELRHQQQQESERRGLAARGYAFTFDPGARQATVQYPETPVTGSVVLYRPSNAALDRTLPIRADASGVQVVDLARCAAGLWKVQVAWVQRGQGYSREHTVVLP